METNFRTVCWRLGKMFFFFFSSSYDFIVSVPFPFCSIDIRLGCLYASVCVYKLLSLSASAEKSEAISEYTRIQYTEL